MGATGIGGGTVLLWFLRLSQKKIVKPMIARATTPATVPTRKISGDRMEPEITTSSNCTRI